MSLEEISIAEVMRPYLKEVAAASRSREHLVHTADPILDWWGSKTLADVRGATCRKYVVWRTSQAIKNRRRRQLVSISTARHDLKTLRAAINHYHREYGPLLAVPVVTLPEKAPARERWLTRHEAARLLWAARRTEHVARFILLGVHTATRHGALLALRWLPSTAGGWIDVDRGVIYRQPTGRGETKKRQPPARPPRHLLTRLRQWRKRDVARGVSHVIHYQGRGGLDKMQKAWTTALEQAGLATDDPIEKVTPHTLRHTAITWAMQRGDDPWEVCGWAGITMEMLDRVYGHHHPDFQSGIGKRREKR